MAFLPSIEKPIQARMSPPAKLNALNDIPNMPRIWVPRTADRARTLKTVSIA